MPLITRSRVVLFVASFATLYFELLYMRWIPGQVRMIAYFTNFVLIACFFGLGAGTMLARHHRDFVRWAWLGVVGLVGLSLAAAPLWVMQTEGAGIANIAEYTGPGGLKVAVHVILLVFYIAIGAAFVPFGQAIGRGFDDPEPLKAYLANLLGSLAGIAVFFVYSFLEVGSWVWFLLGIPALLFLVEDKRSRLLTLGAVVLVVPLVAWVDAGKLWSPYQKLEVRPLAVDDETGLLVPGDGHDTTVEMVPQALGFDIAVNDDFYQHPIDLRPGVGAQWPIWDKFRSIYNIAYQFRPSPDRVLIVGGGSGNDAAAALRNGAKHVDVVEIDPRIVKIGRAGHPEHPYDDPRVTVIVDDARHFFNTAKGKYDVVIFAYIDSHRLMSSFSSLRLDSYLYTVESFRAARRLVDDDGIVVVAFTFGDWQQQRFAEMLRQAWGFDPVRVSDLGIEAPGSVFLQGSPEALVGLPRYSVPPSADTVLATDDWPFVYARWRTIPVDYAIALLTIVIVTTVGLRRLPGGSGVPDLHFFLLGAGFLLLESRNVTTLALVFGSTWVVNTVVFAAVLAMAMVSTLLTTRVTLPPAIAYAGLLLAVVANGFLPLETLAGADLATRLIVVGGVSAAPVFFSGMIFAGSLKRSKDPARAMGSNILGAVCGGVLEYSSLVTGLSFLLVILAGLYIASAVPIRDRLLAQD